MAKNLWTKMKDSFPTALMSALIVIVVVSVLAFSFKVIPNILANGSSYFATTLTSIFMPNEKLSATSSVTQKTPTKKTTAVHTQVTYLGKSDLSITLIGTGIIDPATKQFVQTSYAGANDTVGIKFEIKNIGTNITGIWKLRLNMPSRTTPYYDSEYQISLKPGDAIEYVASFDNPTTQGINTAYVTADPLNQIDESIESNNSLTVPIKIDGTSYSYNNNYNYGSSNTNPSLPYGTLYTWTSMNASCYANPQTAYPGNMITWYVTTSGGNGYFSYSWTGTDGLNSTDRAISKTYTSSGTKTATVVITSNGQTITKQCSAYVY